MADRQGTRLTSCHANRDGDCWHKECPQILDGFCDTNGNPILLIGREHRTCPLPWGRGTEDDE